MQTFYKICLILMIVGGINWGLVGLFQFDFVGWLLGGSASIWSRIVFTLVGLAALCGIPLVIGENVGGGDNKTEFNPDGSIRALPDLDRRIAVYRRYYKGKGALFVQLNANDAYNGVAEYVARKYGDFVCVEIKWGQGAKPINGEGLIRDLDYARFMKSRSYCLRPDPEDPAGSLHLGHEFRAVHHKTHVNPLADHSFGIAGPDVEGQLAPLRLSEDGRGRDLGPEPRGLDMGHVHLGAHGGRPFGQRGGHGPHRGVLHEGHHRGGGEYFEVARTHRNGRIAGRYGRRAPGGKSLFQHTISLFGVTSNDF